MSALTDYTNLPKVYQVIALIAEGKTKADACRTVGLSSLQLNRYARMNSEVQELLYEACQTGYDVLADALVNIDTDPTIGLTDPAMANTVSKNIKWYLERKDRERYGPHVSVNVSHSADKTVISALEKAKARSLGRAPPEVIDLTPVQEETDEEYLARITG